MTPTPLTIPMTDSACAHALKFHCKVHFRSARRGSKRMVVGERPAAPVADGRVPKIARLMALAIRLEGLVHEGKVRDYAEVARLGHVTRARVTQIMNLLMLTPQIQEQLLFLPLTTRGRDPITEHDLRPIAAETDWGKQRRLWGQLVARTTGPGQ